MPDDLSDGDYRTLAAFRHALRTFVRLSEEAARSAGLTPAQHQLLLAVRGWAGPGPAPTLSDVSEQIQVRHHSAVELADRAVRAGLVVRHVDPDDRRRHRLELTADGERTLAALTVAHRDELRAVRVRMAALLDQLD